MVIDTLIACVFSIAFSFMPFAWRILFFVDWLQLAIKYHSSFIFRWNSHWVPAIEIWYSFKIASIFFKMAISLLPSARFSNDTLPLSHSLSFCLSHSSTFCVACVFICSFIRRKIVQNTFLQFVVTAQLIYLYSLCDGGCFVWIVIYQVQVLMLSTWAFAMRWDERWMLLAWHFVRLFVRFSENEI